MVRQQPWDIYEAVILLEATVMLHNGQIDRKTAIIEVSKALRRKAKKAGLVIDEIFRNEAGITFQMYSMESAYLGKLVRNKPATKLFAKTALLRTNDREKYEEILKEAKAMAAVDGRTEYQEWLINNGMTNTAARNYGNWLSNINEYVLSERYSEKALYECSTDEMLNIYEKIITDKKIISEHKDYLVSYRKYVLYRSEGAVRLGRSRGVSTKFNAQRAKYQDWLISTGMKETAARNYGNWLGNVDEYASNQGYIDYSIYECEDVDELAKIYEILINDEELTLNHRDYLTSYRKYMLYRGGEFVQSIKQRRSSRTDNSKRREYQDWLISTGMKETAARNYGNWLCNLDEYALDHKYTEYSLYDYEDPSELADIYEKMSTDEQLVLNHRDFMTSFRKFIFYKSEGKITLGRNKMVSAVSINTVNNAVRKESNLNISAELTERYSQILKEYFEEGLVLNAIRLDKFRMIYEDEFGEEPTNDDEELTEQLKQVGNYIDGRIYPKKGGTQNDLLDEIRNTIRSVLDGGACCVYLSSVIDRWQQPLADKLNIYNEMALRDIVLAENMPDVFATSTYFKNTRNKVYPEQDVLRYMQLCHIPVAYSELQEKLWYFPLDVIKHALVTTPALVQVDLETYLYAPNFPVSSEELRHLTLLMDEKIREKGFLVSKDIAQLIIEKCPTIAINTVGYKDWAYRNILRYILRDHFEFGSSVISEKGKKLEMRQVYRGFCKEYERLTFEELKQFSSEVGVQIYWDDVLQEMVRINRQEMIRKDLVHFDIEATDKVLDGLCQGDYIPINQVGLFLHFPPIEYPWNSYILECYMQQSKRFQLYHVSYSEKGVYGVIVRRNTTFTDYQQVVVDMLANSNEWNNAEEALSLIVSKGYQARKRWSGFDKVVQEALMCREKILNERK